MIGMVLGWFTKEKVGGFLAKNWKWIGIAVVVFLAYVGINRMVENYDAAVAESVRLQEELEVQRGKYEALQSTYDLYREGAVAEIQGANRAIIELREAERANRAEIKRLGDLYAKHDFRTLVKRKPGLVGRRATGATNRLLLDLEEHTRAFSAGGPAGSVPPTPSP